MRTPSSSNLWKRLEDKGYRHAFAAAQFKRFVPFQISALRKKLRWSQQELAERSGLTQGVISRAEDPDNGNLAVNTILKIANGFDVVFLGKFIPYSEFEDWFSNVSEKAIVPDFNTEDAELERIDTPAKEQKEQTDVAASEKVISIDRKSAGRGQANVAPRLLKDGPAQSGQGREYAARVGSTG